MINNTQLVKTNVYCLLWLWRGFLPQASIRRWTISHLMTYVQWQRSVPVQKEVYPLCTVCLGGGWMCSDVRFDLQLMFAFY